MKIKTIIASLVIMIAGAASASAGGWGINASSCTPDNTAIASSLYIDVAGSTGMASGKTGDIVLYCPIPDLPFTPGAMSAVLIDDLANMSNGFIKMQYIKMNQSTGAITVIQHGDSTLGSPPTPGTVRTIVPPAFSDPYDPSTYAYYIRVDISRTSSTSALEVLYAVDLHP